MFFSSKYWGMMKNNITFVKTPICNKVMNQKETYNRIVMSLEK